MNASDLKRQHEIHNPNSHFFDRSSMKFFGDTMGNYYVPVKKQTIVTHSGESHECYELQRRHPVEAGLGTSAWFDTTTFERVLGKGD